MGFLSSLKKVYSFEHEGWMGHYLTLIGYDDTAQAFTSLDTFLGPWDSSGRLAEYETVEKYWAHFNNTFIIIYTPSQEAHLTQIIGPDMMEPATMWLSAAAAARDALEAEPNNAFTWFNLGSSLTHLAQISDESSLYTHAADAFDQARSIGLPWRMLWYQFEPYEAYLGDGRYDEVYTLTEAMLTGGGGRFVEETYLYQGHARLATGDADGAARSYRKALELNPNLSSAREALAELQ